MKNVKLIGLSALAGALAMTSAHAGSVSMSGSMQVSYTKGSGKVTTGNPLGQENELSVAASTELDNGVTVAYKQSITGANAMNDSELVFGNIMGGTLSMASTGSPVSGIDNKTPTAFKDAEGMTGSIQDVNGGDGTFGIRYTLADVLGSGVKVDYMYFPVHSTGDATGDEAFSGGGHGNEAPHELAITGSIEGLSVGVGYYKENYDLAALQSQQREEGTAYATYAYGPLTVGAQLGGVGYQGASPQAYKNTYVGVSYAVSDDLSFSYNKTESRQQGGSDASSAVEQDWDSVSLSYSMGGMTWNIADSDCSNCSYSNGVAESETTISLSVAF